MQCGVAVAVIDVDVTDFLLAIDCCRARQACVGKHDASEAYSLVHFAKYLHSCYGQFLCSLAQCVVLCLRLWA